ncbi:type II secretion system F family protein [Aliidiomarina indica]|uniref:type II secretion system F family protein n=1 Tax=Aliidiomarina indica TaxID=2749147 RepID=UPI00188EAA1E|nr:type II secretion system F family protein [Aliidiomarina indica]
MHWFRWHGVHGSEGIQSGLVQASNLTEVRRQLAQQRIQARLVSRLPALGRGRRYAQWQLKFLYQWHELLESGFDQQSAWQYLHRISNSRESAQATFSVIRQMQQGDSLAHALQQYAVFPTHLGIWVGVGEHTGRLPKVLEQLHLTLKQRMADAQALRSALRYPFIVLAIAFLMLIAMVAFLLPRFADIYAQLDVVLPALTQSLMGLHDKHVLMQFGLALAAIFASAALLRWRWPNWLRQPHGCARIYRIPYIGDYLRTYHLLQDINMLTLALDSHIPLHDSMAYVARFSESGYWRHRWQRCGKMLESGLAFYLCCRHIEVPEHLCQAIHIGEVSGRLGTQLRFASAQLQHQQHAQQEGFLGLLPTLVLIVVSIITLLLLLALYLPLFQLGQIVG